MIAQSFDATTIRASQLTEGDIIQHGSDNWMVITEPEYTLCGITFEVLCLDVEEPNNTQFVCFNPESRFVLLDHQRAVQEEYSYYFDAVCEEEALAS